MYLRHLHFIHFKFFKHNEIGSLKADLYTALLVLGVNLEALHPPHGIWFTPDESY